MLNQSALRKKTAPASLIRRDAYFGLGTLVAMTILLLFMNQHAQAQTPATPNPTLPAQPRQTPNFAEHQQKELAHIAAHIQILQTLQSCVQSATSHESLKACNETAHQSEEVNRRSK